MLIHYKAMPRSVSLIFLYQCAPEGEKQHGVKFLNDKTSPCKARSGNSDFLMLSPIILPSFGSTLIEGGRGPKICKLVPRVSVTQECPSTIYLKFLIGSQAIFRSHHKVLPYKLFALGFVAAISCTEVDRLTN